jgi:hypothetical protein
VTGQAGTPVHRIGRIEAGPGGVRFLQGGRPVPVKPGFDHFAGVPA